MNPRPLFAGLCLGLLAGCGSSGPSTYDVTGTVTWNGTPLAQGDILFEPVDGKGIPGHGKVVNGQFRLRTTAGKKKVQILAIRDTGKIDTVMQSPVRVAFIPARYNVESTLTRDVTAEGENRFDFPLTDQP